MKNLAIAIIFVLAVATSQAQAHDGCGHGGYYGSYYGGWGGGYGYVAPVVYQRPVVVGFGPSYYGYRSHYYARPYVSYRTAYRGWGVGRRYYGGGPGVYVRVGW